MDLKKCHAVYVDDRVQVPRCATKENIFPAGSDFDESAELVDNIKQFCEVFAEELDDDSISDSIPIFAFIDITPEISLSYQPGTRRPSTDPMLLLRTPRGRNPSLTLPFDENDAYGLRLLSRSTSDLQVHGGPNVIIPIAVFREAQKEQLEEEVPQCLDAGAVDVLTCPLDDMKLSCLKVHAYRTKKNIEKEKKRFMSRQNYRKQSWVGMDEQQPYGYLREAMVSKLLKSICNPETAIEEIIPPALHISEDRRQFVESEVAKWSFSAHTFTDDELLHAGCVMVKHTLKMPGLDQWRISDNQVYRFFYACRTAYNSFVLYHNFRHAVDVLQSTFYFLLASGMLPRFPDGMVQEPVNPLASILGPFEVLTLIISAIGHDVGHPGVNNAFLINLRSPLAQLYNDKSVLEAFHCAAYSQILRRYWPAAFKDDSMRKLMICSILATDMGIHGDFMAKLHQLKQKYTTEDVQSWSPKDLEENQRSLCGLIIKSADISNVARQWNIAEKWTDILQQEFYNQGIMEKEVGMKTALFGGPPELGNMVELAKGQIGFMEFFALPLFQGIGELLPGFIPPANEISKNLAVWRQISKKGALLVGQQQRKPSPASLQRQTVIPEEDDHPAEEPKAPASPSQDASEEESPTSPRIPGSFPRYAEADSSRNATPNYTSFSNRTSIASRPSDTTTAPWSSGTFANTMTPISCQTEASSLSNPYLRDQEERSRHEKPSAEPQSANPIPRIEESSPLDARYDKSADSPTEGPPRGGNTEDAPNSLLPSPHIHGLSPQNSSENIGGRSPSRFSSIMTKLGSSPRKSPSRFALGGSPASSIAGNLNIPGAYGDSDVHSHSSQSESNCQSGSSQAPNSPGRTLSKRISRIRLFFKKDSPKAMDVET
ncbi:3',5'-cyclic-nucleotide phosphodiesterase [Ascosphaera pollenicola]|nr:3',5'-cyclic-nucleotide phosphodiesterase [Ascosphaera pollenicola]